jgi:hypothetical protein
MSFKWFTIGRRRRSDGNSTSLTTNPGCRDPQRLTPLSHSQSSSIATTTNELGHLNNGEVYIASASLLCLKCRKSGHVAERCLFPYWAQDPFGWFFSKERKSMDFHGPYPQKLCQRCENLNLLQLLSENLPWKSTSELNSLAAKGAGAFRSLGKTGSTEFWDNCSLCRCLFAMTPSPSSPSQDVLIVPDWTMNRVTGETDTVKTMDRWHEFSKCLLVTLDSESGNLGFSTKAHRGDALCVIEENNPRYSLGGRVISPDLNIHIINHWLSSCSKYHSPKCHPTWRHDLPDIKLVEVSSRQIVQRPKGPFDYIALSYVWGGMVQPSYQIGSKLKPGTLPRTIEDAIILVQMLGKRYLWVDSLCIDQADDLDKARQIMTMQSIYSGAFVTIIALSGSTANSGLPRLTQRKGVHSQLSCIISGKQLVGLMPTLSQQIWTAPWGKRAWTLQEGLLSPRSLYVSDHGLYFECNGMQCCESLNDTRSWAHHLHIDSDPKQGGWLASKVGDGCLRMQIENPSHRLERYGSRLTLYSYRFMTNSVDGINAFTGILEFLQTMYTKGFYQGLPIEDLQWGLLWRSHAPPKRRPGFPTWSWAGWEGKLWPAYPGGQEGFTKPHEYPLHLRICRAEQENLLELFHTQHSNSFPNDPIAKAASLEPADPPLHLPNYIDAQEQSYLFIEAIVLEFAPDYSSSTTKVQLSGQDALFLFNLRGVNCVLRIMSVDTEVYPQPSHTREKKRFLLLARDLTSGYVVLYLLMIVTSNGISVRKTVVEIMVPQDHLEVLEEFQPSKRRIVLA